MSDITELNGFKIGDHVLTKKGGRLSTEGAFSGHIVKFSKWATYDAAIILKDRPYRRRCWKVLCLLHNLVKIRNHHK
jgi:hypothetical protein